MRLLSIKGKKTTKYCIICIIDCTTSWLMLCCHTQRSANTTTSHLGHVLRSRTTHTNITMTPHWFHVSSYSLWQLLPWLTKRSWRTNDIHDIHSVRYSCIFKQLYHPTVFSVNYIIIKIGLFFAIFGTSHKKVTGQDLPPPISEE